MGKMYNLVGKATINMRMRFFKHKILNKILYLNIQLYHMKIAGSSLCSLSGQNVETVTYLFFSRIVSHKLCFGIKSWSTSCIVLPEQTEKKSFVWVALNLINHIVLFYKQFIYKKEELNPK